MIQISLADNKLTKDNPFDRMAIVQNRKIMTKDDIVKQLTGEGSILKDTECNAVINATFKAIAQNLANGYEFKSDYFDLSFGVTGVFENDNDRFDPSRHRVSLSLRLKEPIKEALAKIKVEVIPHNTPMPVIKTVFDRKSKTIDEQLSPGHQLDIVGDLLKIGDVEAEEQGVFLINTATAEEVKVAYIFQNTPKKLEVELPENLAKGSYHLEVRTTVYGAKEVRSGIAPSPLSVL